MGRHLVAAPEVPVVFGLPPGPRYFFSQAIRPCHRAPNRRASRAAGPGTP